MQYYYDQSMMDGGGYGGMWGIFMMAFWVILLLIVGIVVARVFNHNHGYTHHKVDHLDIIKERYAKGDITKEQFEQLKKDLK
jgi:putative membrane protein